jgi:hypothetical protein
VSTAGETVQAPRGGSAAFSRDGFKRAARRLSPWMLAVLPVGVLVLLFGDSREVVAFDFQRSFRPAAEAVLHGVSPYPPPVLESMAERDAFVYLPPAALLFVPLLALGPYAGSIVLTALVTVLGVVALRLVGVRDWRCWGLACLAPTVVSAIQTTNLTLLLLLALGAIWALRERPLAPGAVLAATLATKLFLWPVLVWFVATRRFRAALTTVALSTALVAASWALIGFAGLRDFPALLGVLAEALERDSYTVFALLTDLGTPELVARPAGIAVASAVLLGCWVLGRRGDEARSFTLAIVASLLFTPIVWLHYFALLLVPIGIVHKRLSWLWATPLLFWLAQGHGNGNTFNTAWALGVVALTTLLVLRAAPGEPVAQPAQLAERRSRNAFSPS